jgi:hypothetical protein
VLSWLKIFFKNMLGFANGTVLQCSCGQAHRRQLGSPAAWDGFRPNKDIHSREL